MLQTGDVIGGRYRVERMLGMGGFGVVAAATHLELRNEVAIKMIRPEFVDDAETIERFLREARSVAQLRTEHVCRVFDIGRTDAGIPYIVMELLQGADVASLLRTQPLPVHTAVDYIRQACVALSEAHARNIVHRDLKPPNLFVARMPNNTSILKVLDFGIAKAQDELRLTHTRIALGSPQYMSPEQLTTPKDVDARTDIWSIGVTLYHMLARRLPFPSAQVAELGVMILTQPPAPIDIDPNLRAVLWRCLEKDRNARFQSIEQLAAALAPFVERAAPAISSAPPAMPPAPGIGSPPPAMPPAIGPAMPHAVGGPSATVDSLPHVQAPHGQSPQGQQPHVQVPHGQAPRPAAPTAPGRSRTWMFAALGGVVLAGAAIGYAVFAHRSSTPAATASTANAASSTGSTASTASTANTANTANTPSTTNPTHDAVVVTPTVDGDGGGAGSLPLADAGGGPADAAVGAAPSDATVVVTRPPSDAGARVGNPPREDGRRPAPVPDRPASSNTELEIQLAKIEGRISATPRTSPEFPRLMMTATQHACIVGDKYKARRYYVDIGADADLRARAAEACRAYGIDL